MKWAATTSTPHKTVSPWGGANTVYDRDLQIFEINGSLKFVDVNARFANVFELNPENGELTLESSTNLGLNARDNVSLDVFPNDNEDGFRIIWNENGNDRTHTMAFNADGTLSEPRSVLGTTDGWAGTAAEVDDGAGGTAHFYVTNDFTSPYYYATRVDTATGDTPTLGPRQNTPDGVLHNGNRVHYEGISVRVPQSDGGPDRTFLYFTNDDGLRTLELSADGTLTYVGVFEVPGLNRTTYSANLYTDGDGNQFGVFSGGAVVSFNEDGSVNVLDTGTTLYYAEGNAITINGELHYINTETDELNIFLTSTQTTEPVDCFTRGTLIATDRGEVAIEDLHEGDMVLTMDDGYQPIRWIGVRKVANWALQKNPKLRPIRISAGAMGLNLPQQDLLVSRQHRMMVNSRISARMFDTPEVLVAAIKLCAVPGIYVDEDVKQVEYFHMLFDRHQVVYANGTPSESLFTGPQALKALSAEAREEIETLFPEICAPDFQPTAAREIPEGKRQKKLMERHVKSTNELLMA